MAQEHDSELFEWLQPLPAQLVDPLIQVSLRRSFVGVSPQTIQTLLQQVRFHHPAVQPKQIVQ